MIIIIYTYFFSLSLSFMLKAQIYPPISYSCFGNLLLTVTELSQKYKNNVNRAAALRRFGVL